MLAPQRGRTLRLWGPTPFSDFMQPLPSPQLTPAPQAESTRRPRPAHTACTEDHTSQVRDEGPHQPRRHNHHFLSTPYFSRNQTHPRLPPSLAQLFRLNFRDAGAGDSRSRARLRPLVAAVQSRARRRSLCRCRRRTIHGDFTATSEGACTACIAVAGRWTTARTGR